MILLDLDDTLINHTAAQRTAAQKFGAQFASHIPNYSKQTFADEWASVAAVYFRAFTKGELSFQEQRRRRIRKIFQEPGLPAAQADEIFANHLVHYEASWDVFEDTLPFLNAHTDTRLAILTNGAQSQQELKLKRTGIDHYFEFVITAESAKYAKPDARIFELACEFANLKPDQITYIGDNLEKDAFGARAAGLNGVWLNRDNLTAPDEVQMITSLTDF